MNQTFGFFQFDMQGGIFHSCCSFTIVFLVGECITGAGGDGGPRGIFLLVLNLGGSMGSRCCSTILMTRCLAPELNITPPWEGVYLWKKKFFFTKKYERTRMDFRFAEMFWQLLNITTFYLKVWNFSKLCYASETFHHNYASYLESKCTDISASLHLLF